MIIEMARKLFGDTCREKVDTLWGGLFRTREESLPPAILVRNYYDKDEQPEVYVRLSAVVDDDEDDSDLCMRLFHGVKSRLSRETREMFANRKVVEDRSSQGPVSVSRWPKGCRVFKVSGFYDNGRKGTTKKLISQVCIGDAFEVFESDEDNEPIRDPKGNSLFMAMSEPALEFSIETGLMWSVDAVSGDGGKTIFRSE